LWFESDVFFLSIWMLCEMAGFQRGSFCVDLSPSCFLFINWCCYWNNMGQSLSQTCHFFQLWFPWFYII
jgi:hypothetical protein